MEHQVCRACGTGHGAVVLDLGKRPPADLFPPVEDPGPDPVYPLRMWLCGRCGLAQLTDSPSLPEPPLGREPLALAVQAEAAVGKVASRGWIAPGRSFAEYPTPHGGSWSELLTSRNLRPAATGERADVVLDTFGMMHEPDQASAIQARADRVAPGGVLLLQYHALETILRLHQWNALRHGHYAYYSTTSLSHMLAGAGMVPVAGWTFDLYGGTILLAAGRRGETPLEEDPSVQALLTSCQRERAGDPLALRRLQVESELQGQQLRDWLVRQRLKGQTVVGYGAASRAVVLLGQAGADRDLVAAVADAAPAKQGHRLPGTCIPIVSPADALRLEPDLIVVFIPELLEEARMACPALESSGARWVDVESLRV